MPILRVVSDQKLPDEVVDTIKNLGRWIDYDPRMIWIEVSDGLTQSDVMYVSVTVEDSDFHKSGFPNFCKAVGDYLRDTTHKSVEITHPTNIGMHGISWHPTEEGAQIYGGGQ